METPHNIPVPAKGPVLIPVYQVSGPDGVQQLIAMPGADGMPQWRSPPPEYPDSLPRKQKSKTKRRKAKSKPKKEKSDKSLNYCPHCNSPRIKLPANFSASYQETVQPSSAKSTSSSYSSITSSEPRSRSASKNTRPRTSTKNNIEDSISHSRKDEDSPKKEHIYSTNFLSPDINNAIYYDVSNRSPKTNCTSATDYTRGLNTKGNNIPNPDGPETSYLNPV